MEAPDVRVGADPRGFLALYPPPVIFDEIQYTPDLLAYIKERVDLHRDLPGQFVLTGSQNLLLMQQVTESLVVAEFFKAMLHQGEEPATKRIRAQFKFCHRRMLLPAQHAGDVLKLSKM